MPSEETRISLAITQGASRLDSYLAETLTATEHAATRSQIKRWIDEGLVTVNGKTSKSGATLRVGDVVEVRLIPATPARAVAQKLPLEVLFEDSHLIVVNKPAGMVVHPAPGHSDGTLVNALLGHCTDLSGIGGELRPGIVHRLDRDTSGVMVATKTEVAHVALVELFRKKDLVREYLAVASPAPNASGVFRTLYGRHPIHRKRFSSKVTRGKTAATHYWVEERFVGASLVRCRLETGRTHQIRVHFYDHGFALVGDRVYRRKAATPQVEALGETLARQALHAAILGFVHPVTGETLRFEVPPPADFQNVLAELRQPATSGV